MKLNLKHIYLSNVVCVATLSNKTTPMNAKKVENINYVLSVALKGIYGTNVLRLKRCVNCGGDHSALQMKCPKRKEILKTKRAQLKERENMTYSNITESNLPPKMPTFNVPTITKDEMLKIHICVAHA